MERMQYLYRQTLWLSVMALQPNSVFFVYLLRSVAIVPGPKTSVKCIQSPVPIWMILTLPCSFIWMLIWISSCTGPVWAWFHSMYDWMKFSLVAQILFSGLYVHINTQLDKSSGLVTFNKQTVVFENTGCLLFNTFSYEMRSFPVYMYNIWIIFAIRFSMSVTRDTRAIYQRKILKWPMLTFLVINPPR